jgi:acetaldehyde dehydrogenase
VSRVAEVPYAEIVASVSSKSAGPGTRDPGEHRRVHRDDSPRDRGRRRARRGKAIIILNPAEPPLIMRDTVFALVGGADQDAVRRSIEQMVADVATYVPGYRLVQQVQFTPVDPAEVAMLLPEGSGPVDTKVSVFLEVEASEARRTCSPTSPLTCRHN